MKFQGQIVSIQEVENDDKGLVGGKGSSLGTLTKKGFNVPPGFIVTTRAFRKFIKDCGFDEEIFSKLENLDLEDSKNLQKVSKDIEKLILSSSFPSSLKEELKRFYDEICNSTYVAVRSSATAEDLPEASFAGQQETFLNVKGYEELKESIKKCWASLYTPRSIFYREDKGFDHREVDIAVVIQKMVDAEKSGVMFTSHPITGNPEVVIEAAWSLGEGVVSGTVTPDSYVVDRRSQEIKDVSVTQKTKMFIRKNGSTEKIDVPENKVEKRVLTDEEIIELNKLAIKLEEHYDEPQDVEWAVVQDEIFLLQSRPVTTIKKKEERSRGELILSGLGASPGRATGSVKIIYSTDELDKLKQGDILATEMTTPDMVPAIKRAAAIITDEGGLTSHASIVSRELETPCVVGTKDATISLSDQEVVTVDGDKGKVFSGDLLKEKVEKTEEEDLKKNGLSREVERDSLWIETATDVKANISIPSASSKAAKTGLEGVGLLRIEHIILDLNKTPYSYIKEGRTEEYIEALFEGISTVTQDFYPRPVWVRTLDAPTDEFKTLEGGEDEPVEHNPMLGFRGIRRDLKEVDHFELEAKCFSKLLDHGFDNLGVMLPLVTDPSQVKKAKKILKNNINGFKEIDFGLMIETPAAALTIEELIEEGIDFVSFGTNDLTQYVLAVDRNNENVEELFREKHPAVLRLIDYVINNCKKEGVKTSICGQAGSDPDFVTKLVEMGIDGVSCNIDALKRIKRAVAKKEKKILLERARK